MFRSILGVSAISLGMISGSAMADGHEKKGYGFKIGAELRTEFTYNNNGFQKVLADDPDTSKTWSLQAAKIKMHGNVGENTDYRALLRFEDVVNGLDGNPIQDAVELGHVTHHFSDQVSVRVGKDYVNYGGFERKEQDFTAIYNSPWVTDAAGSLGLSQVGIGFLFDVADGQKITVQIIRDELANANNADDEKPAATVEWMGNFGKIKALAQIGASEPMDEAVYDFGVGLGYKSGGLNGHIDYGYKTSEDATGGDLSWHRLAVHAEYDTGDFIPFAKFTLYDDLSDGADDNGRTPAAMDNLLEFAVGTHWKASGDVFRPYAAVHAQTGEWDSAANEDSPTQFNVKLGVMSQF
jgi:hypothetical protein